jgi:hypothetical protein
MSFDWQNVVALAVVLASAAYVARHAWQSLATPRAVTGCGRCTACPTSRHSQPRTQK